MQNTNNSEVDNAKRREVNKVRILILLLLLLELIFFFLEGNTLE